MLSPAPWSRRAALTVLTAGAIEARRAGTGSMHGVTGAAVLALAFLAAGLPVGTRSTSCRTQAEMSPGLWLQRRAIPAHSHSSGCAGMPTNKLSVCPEQGARA